ncbi:hypothetical protein OC845_004993 [Tilletia horrida]|nr:hypothetical protein OC845_004993 [Tilletia horrida]
MYKTGYSIVYDRMPVHLLEDRPDIPNRLVYSDVAMQLGPHSIIDAVRNVSHIGSPLPEFGEYRRLNQAYADGSPIEPTTSGWELDRYKFAPMSTHAWKTFPQAKWYIGADGDTFIFFSTLLRWLERYFPEPESYGWYLGYDEVGSPDPDRPRYFAHGGAGFVMSQGLMRQIHAGDPDGAKFINDPRFVDIRCGDCALGDYIADLPGRKGHTDAGIDIFHHDGLDKVIFRPRLWHTYVVSLHHNSASQLDRLRQWEKDFLPTLPEWDGVRQCDVLFGMAPAFLREAMQNYLTALRALELSKNGTTSASATASSSSPAATQLPPKTVVKADWRAEDVDPWECNETCLKQHGTDADGELRCDRACDDRPSCYGWRYVYGTCILANNGFRIGAAVDARFEMRTAWRLDRIAALEGRMPCADGAMRAFADERGMGLEYGQADLQNTGKDEGWTLPARIDGQNGVVLATLAR